MSRWESTEYHSTDSIQQNMGHVGGAGRSSVGAKKLSSGASTLSETSAAPF